MRGTFAPSTGQTEGVRVANLARLTLASFPEATIVTSQVGRPDDGTDTTGFFNTEYCVDLKPKEQWRPVFHQNKEALIAAMNRQAGEDPRRDLEFLAAHRRQHGRGRQRREGPAGDQDLRRRFADAGRQSGPGGQGDAHRSRHRGSGRLPAAGPAQLERDGGPPAGRALSNQRGRRPGCHSDRRGRQRADAGAAGRTALRSGGALSGALPRHAGSDREYPPALALGRARLTRAACARSR